MESPILEDETLSESTEPLDDSFVVMADDYHRLAEYLESTGATHCYFPDVTTLSIAKYFSVIQEARTYVLDDPDPHPAWFVDFLRAHEPEVLTVYSLGFANHIDLDQFIDLYQHKDPPSHSINIFTLAKYLELDDKIVGLKLVYAGGASRILRGSCALTSTKRVFNNQVTLCYRIPNRSLYSIKIFHNGAVQLTGARSLDEATSAMVHIQSAIRRIQGVYAVSLKDASPDRPYVAHDGLVYSRDCKILGHIHPTVPDTYFLRGEYVVMCRETIPGHTVLVSKSWSFMAKTVYSLDGDPIGQYRVSAPGLRSMNVRVTIVEGCVYDRDKLVGTVDLSLDPGAHLAKCAASRGSDHVLVDAQPFDKDLPQRPVDAAFFQVHNINVRFASDFGLYRQALHEVFLDRGLYSRFESASRLGVNLRYKNCPRYPPSSPHHIPGVCQCIDPARVCQCKVISVLCFHTGRFVATGFKTLEDIPRVIRFVQETIVNNLDTVVLDQAGVTSD
ncbi:hypothetical protein GGF32_003814 [Allomyces javanicus]|nr:hypothetical protein GGF32_003814 [Allomyces javanicus]